MKRYALILIVFCFGFAPCKKKIVKGFEALNVYDYFKAKEYFEKSLKKHEVAASYGLSKIFFEERNHFFNLDSSLHYINRSFNVIDNYDNKQLEKLKDLGITDTSLNIQYRTLSVKAFEYAKEENSIEAFDEIINKFPDTRAVQDATLKRDSLAFNNAVDENTADAYKFFIDNYPQADQRFKAMELYEQRKFDQISSGGSEKDLVQFIQNNPDSPYLRKAQDELYELYEIKDELLDYVKFIDRYPNNPNVNLAFRNVMQMELYDFSDIGINRFINRYPNSPINAEIESLKGLIESGIIQFEHNSNTWVIDRSGNFLFLKPMELGMASEGLFSFVKGGKTGFFDHKGRIAIDPIYTDAFPFESGLSVVENEGLFGVVDRRGKPVIPVQYQEMGEYAEGIIQAFDGRQYLFFDSKGRVVLKSQLEPIGNYEEGSLVVKENQRYGIVDRDGEFIIIPEYDWIENFNEGFARFKVNGRYGLLNADGSKVLEPLYEFISRESNGIRLLELENEANYFKNGEISDLDIELHDRRESTFKDGYAVVKQKGKYGIIDTSFQKVLPSGYSGIYNLGQGIFSIKDRNKFKIFDASTGRTVKTLYDNINLIGGNKLIVVKDSEVALINRNEEILIPFFKGKLDQENSYIIRTNEGGKKSLFDLDGKEIIASENDEIKPLDQNTFLLIQGKTARVYDVKKNEIIFEKS